MQRIKGHNSRVRPLLGLCLSIDLLHLLDYDIPIVRDTVLQPFLAVKVRLGEQVKALDILNAIGSGGQQEAYLCDGRVWRAATYIVLRLSLGQLAASLQQVPHQHTLDVP